MCTGCSESSRRLSHGPGGRGSYMGCSLVRRRLVGGGRGEMVSCEGVPVRRGSSRGLGGRRRRGVGLW